jgi:hypothetical protein
MKTKSLGGCAQPLWIAASVLAAGAVLAGAGAVEAAAAAAPCRCCRSHDHGPGGARAIRQRQPLRRHAANRDPVPGSEPMPSLRRTAARIDRAAGNDSEGIYVSLLDIAFVGADGSIASKDHIGTIWGSIKVDGPRTGRSTPTPTTTSSTPRPSRARAPSRRRRR